MVEIGSGPNPRGRDWVGEHAHARRQRARLMRILFRRAWRAMRRRLANQVRTPAPRPAYEYWL